MRSTLLNVAVGIGLTTLVAWNAHAQTVGTPTVLPRPDFHFSGSVGRTFKESDPPQFPQPVQAPKGAPNVVLILLDDTGFGQYSTFGGGVPSPTLDSLAREGLLAAAGRRKSSTCRIADLGTGAGALVLALLSELPHACGIGTDISFAAVACARENADTLGLSARTRFAVCDYGTALAGPIDIVVSNPPYVVRGDIAALSPEVRDHDPPRALDGGADGLDGYRAIAADARRLLAPDGILVVEIGCGQLAAARTIFAAVGLAPAGLEHDLSGTARALVLRPAP